MAIINKVEKFIVPSPFIIGSRRLVCKLECENSVFLIIFANISSEYTLNDFCETISRRSEECL